MTGTTPTSPPRFVVVGADRLLIECAELLLARGLEITAVVAGSARVEEWAHAHQLRVLDATQPTAEWLRQLGDEPFEWLLAITHLAVLPADVLALPRRGAVNFHDGPLPRYAGLNTPAWAIINGEQVHGITWHLVTDDLDGGPILAEQAFEISPGETSLSLNTKTFAAALDTFTGVLDQLTQEHVASRPQAPGGPHHMYRRADRPEGLCRLDWRRPAVELDRLVRALHVGPYSNPLGIAKCWTATGPLLVTATEVVDAHGTPGTVLSVADDRLVVACGVGALAITGTQRLDGSRPTPGTSAAEHAITEGTALPVAAAAELAALDALGTALARDERFHLARLLARRPIELPWAQLPQPGHRPLPASLPVRLPAGTDDGTAVAALAILLARLSGATQVHLAAALPRASTSTTEQALLLPAVVLHVDLELTTTVARVVADVDTELAALGARAPIARELLLREPALAADEACLTGHLAPLGVALGHVGDGLVTGSTAELHADADGWSLHYDRSLLAPPHAALLANCLAAIAAHAPGTTVAEVDVLGAALRHTVLDEWNATTLPVPTDQRIHDQFATQVALRPDEPAVCAGATSLTYRQLDERATDVAVRLAQLGVGPDHLVGIHLPRGVDLVAAVLGVLKAGGAYVPLDPAYPRERIMHMIADSRCGVVLTDSSLLADIPLPADAPPTLVATDSLPKSAAAGAPDTSATGAHHLAYCLYTSGSTGVPKGVMVEHRNVVNFFAGMDPVVPHDPPGTWLAVTSLSFDISVLELLYTLTRGFTVVLHDPSPEGGHDRAQERMAHLPMEFSLFYFSGDEAEHAGPDKYRLLLEGAKWADEHDFCAVWTPERHFHAFGGLYPQPAITGAAVAAVTSRLSIRAGSVVMPLHHPIRVAEAWSVVDNLSNGRVGISVASGWQPDDFVLAPEHYANAKQVMFDNLEAVKRLWAGERVTFPGVDGALVEVATLPRPVQADLPVWVTTAGNPETYVQAGTIGANVLTHLLGQSVDELAPKIAAYRAARAAAGFDADAGVVSLMLHTFVAPDAQFVRDTVRQPLRDYLGTSLSLLRQYADSFPAFRGPKAAGDQPSDEFAHLSDDERDAMLDHAVARYYDTAGLFGTPTECRATVDRLKAIGVDEIACLVDFGIASDVVLANLPHLGELRRLTNATAGQEPAATDAPASFADTVRRHHITHLQCTPSTARLLMMDDADRAALGEIPHLFIGGEAFPTALAGELRELAPTATVVNMYGPTETTIWSTTWPVQPPFPATLPIGTPIANTSVYVLDRAGAPQPPGVPGALWIGGLGVTRGYWQRPELTAERFVNDPFRGDGTRMYDTGDVALWRPLPDGGAVIDFRGRSDHQVKIRGYRIELGEVEAALEALDGVREAAANVRTDAGGDQQLVAYLTLHGTRFDVAAAKQELRSHLPEVMVPAAFAVLDALPHTPNGKVDRGRLPWPLAAAAAHTTAAAPSAPAADDAERLILSVWHEVLENDTVGVLDNFFDVGGHSLLVVRLHRRLRQVLSAPVTLTDLYRYPTVRGLAEAIAGGDNPVAARTGVDRAKRRLETLQRGRRS